MLPVSTAFMPLGIVGAVLQDACGVVRSFMDRDEGEMRFTITALAASTDDE